MIKLRKCVICGVERHATKSFKTCSGKCRQALFRKNKKDNDKSNN